MKNIINTYQPGVLTAHYRAALFFGNYDAKDFYIYSNACAKIYETKENDLKKAYNKFLTTLETGFGTALLEMLPKTLPAKNTVFKKIIQKYHLILQKTKYK